ncbi:MAG: hypothetical protein DRQ62_05785 [Gammaproteobacteria bacterium]|nr:MAG: hypothetical protein DRQ62_05785 [Gammaproteobacteria bacterium]
MKQTTIPGLIDHELEAQAMSLFQSAKFKEASKLFKKLLHGSDNNAWRQKLAYCYVQRAIGFASKAMYKEALVLWENHIQYAQPPYAAYDQSILWRLLANNQADIQQSLGELSTEQLDKQYPALAAVLGLLILTERAEIVQDLPQDSVFIAHYTIVQTAIQAYQDNHSEKLKDTLKLLPYRSAFRDFRSLLNAIITMDSSLQQAQSLLAKISANSAYFPLANLLHACTKEGAELLQELVHLSHQQRRVIGDIKGLTKRQMEFIEYYCRQQNNLSDKVQFNMTLHFQSLVGTELAQQFCQAMMPRYPAGKKDFDKHFAEASEFEENRINALNCEQDDNLYDAGYYWNLCIRNLEGESADNGFKIALILRHMAAQAPAGDERNDLLIKSLDFDAEDRSSYVQIINYFSYQDGTVKDYKLWLNKALEKFPQDIEVLTLAVKLATGNKTYKKASQYASKILKIDPLNSFAKQTLFSSHMAYARRLMCEKKYLLVAKEIKQLEKLNLGKMYFKQVQLMHALLCFANEDKQQGLQKIIAALRTLHTDPVSMHLDAVLQALLNGLPVSTILRELPSAKECLLSAQELTEFIQQLSRYLNDNYDREYIQKALDKIKAPLKKSIAEQDYTEQLILSLCQVLDKIGHFELLRHCAKTGQIKWKKPIWMYYRIYADHNGEVEEGYSYLEIQRLQNANDQASREKDYPTAILIDTLLDRYFAEHPQQSMGFLEGLLGFDEDQEDEFDDPLEELFGHLPDGVLIDLNKVAESLTKKVTPEKLITSLLQQADGHEGLLMAVMQNPDVFSALMLLKASDELQIDIEVNIYDVIEVFDISESNNPLPFPF